MNPIGIVKTINRARANHPLMAFCATRELRLNAEALLQRFGFYRLPRTQLIKLCSLNSIDYSSYQS